MVIQERFPSDPFGMQSETGIVERAFRPYCGFMLRFLRTARLFIFGTALVIATALSFALAQGNVETSDIWTGLYVSDDTSLGMTLVLQDIDDGVIGEAQDASGTYYQVFAQTSGTYGAGVLLEVASGTQFLIGLQREENGLILSVSTTNPDGTPTETQEFTFTQQALITPETNPSANTPTSPQPDTQAGDVDTRLVGSWQYNDSYVSGDFSMVSVFFMALSADGTFVYGSGGNSGGGNAGSVSSGGRVTNRGQWRTQGDVLYLNEGPGWVPYARFLVDAQELLLIFGDDSRQFWQRTGY